MSNYNKSHWTLFTPQSTHSTANNWFQQERFAAMEPIEVALEMGSEYTDIRYPDTFEVVLVEIHFEGNRAKQYLTHKFDSRELRAAEAKAATKGKAVAK